MNSDNDFNVAARYCTVRKHLDSLGYKHALTLDALPLIEKLLADLIQTTESLKHFKSIAQENIEAHTQLQSAVDPYKCDNVRLIQECNRLHLDLVEAKESHQKQIKELKREIYKLECECNDLQLASSRNLHKIKELETESSKKSKKILELQGKCLKPTISNVGLGPKKRSCYPLRRPVLDSEALPKTSAKINLPNLTVQPKVVDLLNMADHKMNCLSHEVTKLKGELALQTDNVQTLKSQLATKEKEIIRLKKMLEGGRPYSAVSKDCVCKKGENNFIMSSDKVDINELKSLQQAKLELEQQLKEALNKQHDAMTQALKLADRNEELEKELRDIDHIALAVEADCNSAVKENNKRVSKLQQKLEDVMTQVHVLEGELTVERREVQELRADLEACKLEKRHIQRTLESTLDEKKLITDRINELTVIEKNLNDEIERLSKENEKQRQDIIQLQYSNKSLKEQMHVNGIVEGGGTNLREGREKGRKNDRNNRGQNGEFQERYNERDSSQNVNTGYDNLLKQLHEKETQISNLQHTVEQIRRERDFYKDEYNNIKDYHSKTIEQDNVDLWARIRDLKRQLSAKENALDELHREKKELFREKANLETRLQTYKTQHKISHRPCNVCKHGALCKCSSPGAKDTSMTKGIIERLEHERDIARADVERLMEERDALRERLKMAAEAHTSEQRRLRENLTEVESRLKQIEKERQDLLLTQGARRATINGLEDQLQDLREELRRTKEELGTQRTQYFQLRALQDQTDQALVDVQNQLTQSESELNKALDRNRAMERQQMQLENQVKELQQDINNLKANITHLDHEKDQLLMILDEKTERIAALEREMMLKDQQMMGSEQQIRELQHKNEISIDQSAEQERQLRSMQLELENLQRQLQTATYDRENAIQENRRVQDDLAAVTCEVRNLQRELEASRAESFDLKRQLQTYVSEVRRVEDLLNRKDNERTEMLNHFRSLSLEATVLENNNHSLESEAAEARGALQSARDRLLDLERQLADRDSLIRGYETQISELTQNVASVETQLRQQEEQRHRVEADLTAVRDLCMKLDHQKDALMQQLDDKDSLKSQYDMQIAKLKAEQSIIQDQMTRDRATVERLELLLDQARQESVTVQANNQELQNEMSRLRQEMSELQNKLSSESAKLRQYQTQAAEYCKQISELRRQVTNERFDRARKDEETRRHSEGIPESLTPSPSPTNRIPNESNDATHRYLQKEENGERGVNREIRTPKFRNLINEGKCRCGDSYLNGVQRDVPCINIILRSERKTSNKCFSHLQREISMNEKKPVIQNNENLIRKGSGSSKTYVLSFDSSNKRYDYAYLDSKNWSNLSRPAEMQYKAKYNGENAKSTFDNASRIQYASPLLSCSTNEGLNDNKIWNNEVKRKLSYSVENEVVLDQSAILSKENIKASNIDKKIDSNVNVNKRKGSMESYKKLEIAFSKGLPATTLENSVEKDNEYFTKPKIDVLPTLKKIEETKENSEKTNFKSSLQETIQQKKDSPTLTKIHFPTDVKRIEEGEENSTKTDLKSNIEKTIQKKKYLPTLKHVEEYHCEGEKCKSFNCDYMSDFKNTSVTTELMKPECMRMLMEIKERTKTLEEQLTVMNKTMKTKRKAFEKFLSTSERSMNLSYDKGIRRDSITQTPEKKNICIQEPSHNDMNYVKCGQLIELNSKNKYDLQQDKKEHESVQLTEKRKMYMKETRKDTNYKESTLNNKDIESNKEKLSFQIKNQIEPTSKEVNTRVTFKGSINNSDLKSNGKTMQRNNHKSMENYNASSSETIQKLQDQGRESVSFIFDDSSFRPLASSTPRKLDLLNDSQSFCYTSNCTKKSSLFHENLEMKQVETLKELINHPLRSDDTHNEKTIIMLFLTRSIHSRYLKSKYKKFEFMNFKPKCIIDTCDQRLLKCRTPRRKMQTPTVFRQFKFANYKIEKYCDSNTCDHFIRQRIKDHNVSDLLDTVCTQSSNLYITTATSVSHTTFNNNDLKNVPQGRMPTKEACILC